MQVLVQRRGDSMFHGRFYRMDAESGRESLSETAAVVNYCGFRSRSRQRGLAV
jgi:hypothetical protein